MIVIHGKYVQGKRKPLIWFFFLLYLSSSTEGFCVYGCVFSGGRSTFISLVFLQSFIHTNCSINKTRRTNYGPAISPSAASSCMRAVLARQRRRASSVWQSRRWAAERSGSPSVCAAATCAHTGANRPSRCGMCPSISAVDGLMWREGPHVRDISRGEGTGTVDLSCW